MKIFDPIQTNAQSAITEHGILGDSQFKSFAAMERAGTKIADMILAEFGKMLGQNPRIIAISGGGHNGGDALIAARLIAQKLDKCSLVAAVESASKMKPNTARALCRLQSNFRGQNLEIVALENLEELSNAKFDLMIEGISGMSFVPPARENMVRAINAANRIECRLKVAVDIPAGAHETPQSPIFKADATYAAGIAKAALFEPFNRPFTGRIRYADIGFFNATGNESCDDSFYAQNASTAAENNARESAANGASQRFIMRSDALSYLSQLRASVSDKRGYGHLFVIAGSRSYAGAALACVKSALRGGCGLVTAFVPETFAPAFAAAEPSAIWVGCPEDENGAIALESFGLIAPRLKSATAIAAGSGLTSSPETAALLSEIFKISKIPAVLDADAITDKVVSAAAREKLLLTPHEGEILRIAPDASDASLLTACKKYGCSIALKASITRISDGTRTILSTSGSPVLSRAGSGDILAGLCGALMCNQKLSAAEAGALASQWLGIAAQKAFAHAGSETPLATSDIAKFLPDALARDFCA